MLIGEFLDFTTAVLPGTPIWGDSFFSVFAVAYGLIRGGKPWGRLGLIIVPFSYLLSFCFFNGI
jgi:hypothetical protein